MTALVLFSVLIIGSTVIVSQLRRRAETRSIAALAWPIYAGCLFTIGLAWYLVEEGIVPRSAASVLLVFFAVGYLGLYEGYHLMRLLHSRRDE